MVIHAVVVVEVEDGSGEVSVGVIRVLDHVRRDEVVQGCLATPDECFRHASALPQVGCPALQRIGKPYT